MTNPTVMISMMMMIIIYDDIEHLLYHFMMPFRFMFVIEHPFLYHSG